MTPVEIIGAGTLFLAILGLLVRVIVVSTLTQSRADAAKAEAEAIRREFTDYRIKAASEFATHAHLKALEDRLTASLGAFHLSLERNTVRLDAILQHLSEKYSKVPYEG